jgi:hypothetical protein
LEVTARRANEGQAWRARMKLLGKIATPLPKKWMIKTFPIELLQNYTLLQIFSAASRPLLLLFLLVLPPYLRIVT